MENGQQDSNHAGSPELERTLHRIGNRDQLVIDDRSLTPEYGARAFGIRLETPRDAEILRDGLERRADDLAGLAKKNTAEGYKAAARVQLGDAAIIRERMLPQLGGQLALAAEPSLTKSLEGIRRALETRVRRVQRDAIADAENQPELVADRARADRATELAGDVVEALQRALTELWETAYHAGLSERQNTFDRLAVRAVATFEGAGG